MKSTFFGERDNRGILGKSLMQDFTQGLVLAEFFEISEKAREGGMGDVFFCRDKRDNKFYVLKTSINRPENQELFRKECLTVLGLWKHPYVAYSKTIVSDKERYYIVMDFIGKQPYNLEQPVQGETLSKVMSSVKIEPKQALIWAIQFCQGMQFLYQSGIETHKDIKPDNILITPENNIKITDFGLAGLEKKGGTVGYRAPEYFKNGESLTVQSDIYSFGLVLYQMLNGGKTLPHATVWDENTKEFEKLNVADIKTSHCLEIITKCLAESPKDRYKDFYQLEMDITSYLKKEFPEFTFPKTTTEKMTEVDYFLKGLGYYYINEKLWSFLLLSLAIFEDPKMAEAYYYRGKLAILSPLMRGVCITTFLLLLFGGIYILYLTYNGKEFSVLGNWLFGSFILWGIGLFWILFVTAKELGAKTFNLIRFLVKNIFIVFLNRDLKRAYSLNPHYPIEKK